MVLQLLACVMHGVNHGGGCIRNRCEGLVTNAGRLPPSSGPTVRAVRRSFFIGLLPHFIIELFRALPVDLLGQTVNKRVQQNFVLRAL